MTADAHRSPSPSRGRARPTRTGGIGNPVLGMLLFITSEVMFFAGLFAAYFSIRAGYTELIGGRPARVAAHGVRGPAHPLPLVTPTASST